MFALAEQSVEQIDDPLHFLGELETAWQPAVLLRRQRKHVACI